MKTKFKDHALPIISSVLLVIFALLNILTNFISDGETIDSSTNQAIVSAIIGSMVILTICLLVKEEHLFKVGLGVYAIIIGMFVIQYIFGFDAFWLDFMDVEIHPEQLLSLTSVGIAAGMYKYGDTSKKYIPIIMALLPLPLSYFQEYFIYGTFILYFISIIVALVVLKCEKKINVSWLVYAAVAVLMVAFTVYLCIKGHYFHELIKVILSRGKSAPDSTGYIRTITDKIFTSSQLIGKNDILINENIPYEAMMSLERFKSLIILLEYGWILFAALILFYIGFFVILFKMVKKTNQSSFAKNLSLFAAIALVSHAAVSLFALFLGSSPMFNMPFMESSYSINIVEYILYGMIISLNIKRNKPSIINEIGKEKETDKTLSLVDEHGKTTEFDVLDLVYYKRGLYICLSEITENDEPEEVTVLKIEHEGDKLDLDKISFISVDDEATLERVFELFKENTSDDYNFVD